MLSAQCCSVANTDSSFIRWISKIKPVNRINNYSKFKLYEDVTI